MEHEPVIALALPYPPSINNYYGKRRSGQVFIKQAGMDYRNNVILLIRSWHIKKRQGEVELQIAVWPPDKRKRDLDNVLKALLDAMQHAGVYDNDCQIYKLSIERFEKVKGGRIVVVVKERG